MFSEPFTITITPNKEEFKSLIDDEKFQVIISGKRLNRDVEQGLNLSLNSEIKIVSETSLLHHGCQRSLKIAFNCILLFAEVYMLDIAYIDKNYSLAEFGGGFAFFHWMSFLINRFIYSQQTQNSVLSYKPDSAIYQLSDWSDQNHQNEPTSKEHTDAFKVTIDPNLSMFNRLENGQGFQLVLSGQKVKEQIDQRPRISLKNRIELIGQNSQKNLRCGEILKNRIHGFLLIMESIWFCNSFIEGPSSSLYISTGVIVSHVVHLVAEQFFSRVANKQNQEDSNGI